MLPPISRPSRRSVASSPLPRGSDRRRTDATLSADLSRRQDDNASMTAKKRAIEARPVAKPAGAAPVRDAVEAGAEAVEAADSATDGQGQSDPRTEGFGALGLDQRLLDALAEL